MLQIQTIKKSLTTFKVQAIRIWEASITILITISTISRYYRKEHLIRSSPTSKPAKQPTQMWFQTPNLSPQVGSLQEVICNTNSLKILVGLIYTTSQRQKRPQQIITSPSLNWIQDLSSCNMSWSWTNWTPSYKSSSKGTKNWSKRTSLKTWLSPSQSR